MVFFDPGYGGLRQPEQLYKLDYFPRVAAESFD
jgi:hypothetical protein